MTTFEPSVHRCTRTSAICGRSITKWSTTRTSVKTLADECHNWVMERVGHPNSPTYHVTCNVASHECAQRAWTGKEKEVDLSVFVEEMGKCPAYQTRIDFPSGQKESRFNPGSRR